MEVAGVEIRTVEVNVDIVKTLTNGTKIITYCWEEAELGSLSDFLRWSGERWE